LIKSSSTFCVFNSPMNCVCPPISTVRSQIGTLKQWGKLIDVRCVTTSLLRGQSCAAKTCPHVFPTLCQSNQLSFDVIFSEGMLVVEAFRSKMFYTYYVASLKETATHGGARQQIPPTLRFITLVFPLNHTFPPTNTGAG